MANFPGKYTQAGLGNLPDYSGNGPVPPAGIPPAIAFNPASSGQPVEALNDKQSYWQSLPFIVGTSPILLQPFLLRKFFLIQNKDPANTIYVGFGWQPNAANGLVLGPGVGYEPFSYPVNEIWVIASAANTVGLLITGY